jgi:hypothetical protein
MTDLVLSIAMLAALLLTGGGMWLIVKRRDYKRGTLMIVAGAVIFMNVWIWSLPIPGQ